ncbi:MAG: prepilin peptidase, partial [Azonexus sp.]
MPFESLDGLAAVAGLLGLCVGSFLNVVIHRLPKMMEQEWHAQCADLRGETPSTATAGSAEPAALSLAKPRSRCPSCGHQITALENIPIFSYLLLRGKCSSCAAPISPRYPVIEAITALLSAYAAW